MIHGESVVDDLCVLKASLLVLAAQYCWNGSHKHLKYMEENNEAVYILLKKKCP
jgi:hypothetical protein